MSEMTRAQAWARAEELVGEHEDCVHADCEVIVAALNLLLADSREVERLQGVLVPLDALEDCQADCAALKAERDALQQRVCRSNHPPPQEGE